MWFEDCQDDRLGYFNRPIFAIMTLYVALIATIKFQLNPTYGLGVDVVWAERF